MKHRILNMFTAAGLALAVALIVSTFATPKATGGALPAAQERHEAREDFRRAEVLLRDARGLIAAAPGEYGGHRDKAIKRIDEALGEVHEAIEHH
jgi:hypothetical protein